MYNGLVEMHNLHLNTKLSSIDRLSFSNTTNYKRAINNIMKSKWKNNSTSVASNIKASRIMTRAMSQMSSSHYLLKRKFTLGAP